MVGGPLNDLTIVKGNLVLDGTLNVATPPGGSFDPGVYRVISYDGALTNNGLAIGTIPSPVLGPDGRRQAGQPGQYRRPEPELLGRAAMAGKNNGTVDGGPVAEPGGQRQLDQFAGVPNAPYADATFAIFMAAPGNVTVDNSLGQAQRRHAASNGYRLLGGAIELVPDAGGGTTSASATAAAWARATSPPWTAC